MNKSDVEYFLGDVYNMFCVEVLKPIDYTWQKIYLGYICQNTLKSNNDVTLNNIDKIKETFLMWQSHINPSVNKFKNIEKYGRVIIDDFSHDNDLSWNDLNNPIIEHIVSCYNIKEITCTTHQEYLQELFSKEQDLIDEKWIYDAQNTDVIDIGK